MILNERCRSELLEKREAGLKAAAEVGRLPSASDDGGEDDMGWGDTEGEIEKFS
jgi:hypothetical protein